MRAKNEPGFRGRTHRRSGNTVPDGSGGTIAGGAMKPLDLMELLSRDDGGRAAGVVSGAVSGAMAGAQRAGAFRAGVAGESTVALSDGSRIVFATFAGEESLAEA